MLGGRIDDGVGVTQHLKNGCHVCNEGEVWYEGVRMSFRRVMKTITQADEFNSCVGTFLVLLIYCRCCLS